MPGGDTGVALFSSRSARRSKWSPCRCESRTKWSGDRSSTSTAGFVARPEVSLWPGYTWSPACTTFGSVKMVKPAYRITTVAGPRKNTRATPEVWLIVSVGMWGA